MGIATPGAGGIELAPGVIPPMPPLPPMLLPPNPPGPPRPPVWVFWFAQFTRIARDPSHSPFIVAIACSASAFSLRKVSSGNNPNNPRAVHT